MQFTHFPTAFAVVHLHTPPCPSSHTTATQVYHPTPVPFHLQLPHIQPFVVDLVVDCLDVTFGWIWLIYVGPVGLAGYVDFGPRDPTVCLPRLRIPGPIPGPHTPERDGHYPTRVGWRLPLRYTLWRLVTATFGSSSSSLPFYHTALIYETFSPPDHTIATPFYVSVTILLLTS